MTGWSAGGAARRVADVLAEVASAGPRRTWPASLVQLCRQDTGAAGVGLAVADDRGPVGVAAATAGLGQVGEDLQFALGEGPCRWAAASGQVVQAPELAGDTRWVHYAREASAAGIAAVTSVPLLVGAVRVGVLDVYRSTPGPLEGAAAAGALTHAEVATAVLLLLQHSSDQVGGDDVRELVDIRPVVHQAAGMVAIQLDVDLAGALLRLRGHAFAAGVPLREVAAAVVVRTLVFDHSDTGYMMTTEDDDDERT